MFISPFPGLAAFGVDALSVPWDLFTMAYAFPPCHWCMSANEAMGPGLDSNHGSTMVANSVLIPEPSGVQYRSSDGAPSDSHSVDTLVVGGVVDWYTIFVLRCSP